MTKVECEDGKYTFFIDNNGEIIIHRFGSSWFRAYDAPGDLTEFPSKAIIALISKCEQQENKIKELEDNLRAYEQFR